MNHNMQPQPTFQELRTGLGYPDVPLPEIRDWNTEDPIYQPVEYTAESVKGAVADWDAPNAEACWWRARALSCAPHLSRDPATGLARNPAGRTGITGHGRLRDLGPNLTADGIITQGDYVLLIERSDTGQLAFPGGFRDVDGDGCYERSEQTMRREVREETGIILPAGRTALLNAGVARLSLRNTDQAWIENTALHMPLPQEAGFPEPQAQDDAVHAEWLSFAHVDLDAMSDAHAENMRKLLSRR